MAKPDDKTQRLDAVVINPRDIVFECPACGKNLVVDEAAQGMIVDCPQCRINVIVPPKSPAPAGPVVTTTPTPPTPPAPKPAAAPKPVPPVPVPPVEAKPKPSPELAGLQEKLVSLGNQLKELQTQRVEINTRLASRINEVNRDLVLAARLESSHQQLMAEWQQLVNLVNAQASRGNTSASAAAGRSRVQFGH